MPTQLCLLRHAIAEERSLRWPDDGLRPLTEEGADRMREAAAGLWVLFAPDVILTSPLVRAHQTAAIVGESRPSVRLLECDALASGDDVGLLEAVAACGAARVVAVGHEPHLSTTLSNLLTGDSDAVASLFRKGAAALVTFAARPGPGAAGLEWLLQPSALRAIGRSGRER